MKLTSCEGSFILSRKITAVNIDMKKTSLFTILYLVSAGGGAAGVSVLPAVLRPQSSSLIVR